MTHKTCIHIIGILSIIAAVLPLSALCQPVYYPLSVGTRWHYYNSTPMSSYQPDAPTEVIGDTVMSNGKTYAVIRTGNLKDRDYQRMENDSVFQYSIYAHQETLLFRFNASEKDTVITEIRGNDTTDVILTDTTISRVFGRVLRVYTFYIDSRRTIDEERTIRIADSIGIISTDQGPEIQIRLGGAVIDGVKYGTIQTFDQRYYPLSIGNQWQYDSTAHPYTVKVVSDTLMSNGLHYRVLNREDLANGLYVRADSHFVYYYDLARLKEGSVFKLDGQKGDTTRFAFRGFDRSIIMAIDTVTMFGERTRLIHYRLDGIIQQDVTLSDKFGPVSASYYGDPPAPWPDLTDNVVGCIIDGWRYGLVTSVRPGQETVPAEFTLSQNYPNPFNPSTTIQFSLAKPATVRLEIFDGLGRRVATLASERLPAGSYTRTWNAAACASGVYYYRLAADSRSEIKKMLLLR